jgi:hypothetical protein
VSDTLTLSIRFNVPLGFPNHYVNSILSVRRLGKERYDRRVSAFFNKITH